MIEWVALVLAAAAFWLAWKAADRATTADSVANSARVQAVAAHERIQSSEDRERGRAILSRKRPTRIFRGRKRS
jgi:hypothetical protein